MLLTRTLIAVFVAHGTVYLPSHQTHAQPNNSTDPAITRPSLQSPNFTDAEVLTETFRDSVIGTHFQELKNVSALSRLENVKSRRKRSIFNLASMVGCSTNCNRLYLMWYGNYCGWNLFGSNGSPQDDIDRCCYKHDNCYQWVADVYDKWFWTIHWRSYGWNCNGGDPYCFSYQDGWKKQVCRCDLNFVKCLQKSGCPRW